MHTRMADSTPDQFPLPKRGEIRIAPLAVVPDLLREFGVAPGPFLKAFGLSEAFFRQPDNPIAFQLMGRLLKACARQTGCPHFGLLVGQHGNAATLGAPGFLIRNAPDVVTALNEAISSLFVHDRGAVPFIEVGDKTTVLGYAIHQSGVEGADQIGDGALAVIWNIMRGLCGSAWRPLEVRFRHDRPADVGAYRCFFQAPLRFNAAHNAVVFSTAWLGKPVQLADPLLRQQFLQHIAEMRQYSDLEFRDRVYQALMLLLGARRCTLDDLAGHFSLHPRTLNRRLSDAGTSFRALHNEALHQTARQLLCDTGASIEGIAAMLGYSDASAFNRAFSQWEGVPPARWRKQMLATSG